MDVERINALDKLQRTMEVIHL